MLFNSGTLNAACVREVGTLLGAEFDAIGFETRWVDMPPAMQRAGHMVAWRVATQGQRMLFIGPNTVFEKDDPYRRG